MYQLLKTFALPPANLFLLAAVGLALGRRRPRLGRGLVIVAIALLYLLSTPYFSAALLYGLERDQDFVSDPAAGAIVVLSAGLSGDPWREGLTADALALERARTAARLHRATGLPILASGGTRTAAHGPMAYFLGEALNGDLGVPVSWYETRSGDTDENARFSAALLAREGIARAYVVTQRWHLPRARLAFRRWGVEPAPAPASRTLWPEAQWTAFLPSAKRLSDSYYALHELFGILAYRLRYLAAAGDRDSGGSGQ